ncbi:MAG: hypothetical protein K0Q60_4948 [Microvirga sp.]|jgi:hypothetical protein|nr:hypothetical protein [Microvirga sp.]
MSSTHVLRKAIEAPRTRPIDMKPEVAVIPASGVRNSARAAIVRLAFAAVLVSAASFQARAQNCPPGYKVAAGACVQSCPGGYEDTGRICVYRRQGGGGGS